MASQVVTVYMTVSEITSWTSSFLNELPDDTSLDAMDSGSEVNAFSTDGTDVTSTILANRTVSGMNVTFDIKSLTDGEEYYIRVEGGGVQTGDVKEKILRVICRDDIPGGL